jgi:hypothetical protein
MAEDPHGLTVDSLPGKGSRFGIGMPLADNAFGSTS